MFVCNYKCIKERELGTTTTKLWSDKLCFKQELAGKRQRYHLAYFLDFYPRPCFIVVVARPHSPQSLIRMNL